MLLTQVKAAKGHPRKSGLSLPNRRLPVSHYHVVVWLDHTQARVFSINPTEVDATRLLAHPDHRQVHHKAGSLGSGKADEDSEFFREITAAINTAGEILIVGPGIAKLELIRYLQRHNPASEGKVVGVETVDHPTDHQIVAYARRYFRAADRMRPQHA